MSLTEEGSRIDNDKGGWAMSTITGADGPHSERIRRFETNSGTLASARPEFMKVFWQLHKEAVSSGALEPRIKELIALAISVVEHCDDCIAHHVADALQAGADREEIVDALSVAVLMGGGASLVYASHAIEAVDEFLGAQG